MWNMSQPPIEFLCAKEDLGVIAEPRPAKEIMPDWWKKLPAVDTSALSPHNNGQTVKRCMPFLDAMTLGYILPLAATVRIEVSENGQRLDAGWDFDRPMLTFHGKQQVAGHHQLPRPPAKFHNYWNIRTPKGWSCLFVPLINRENAMFEIAAGVVDTDTYHSLIHFPFFPTAPDGRYTLERNLPMVQVIPFKRAEGRAVIRAETSEEEAVRTKILRQTQVSDGWYRLHARAKR